jgi:8-hydroxy-5-deazaflavin:NADPH oxidoreductase
VAAAFGNVVVVSISFYAYRDLSPDALAGKIVIDTMNYFEARDGAQPEIQSGVLTSSELLARHLSRSRVVRAFNAIISTELATDARPEGASDRRAVGVAGDDSDAKATVEAMISSLVYDPVDAGALSEGKRMEAGGPIFNMRLDAAALHHALTF